MLNCREITERASDFIDASLPWRVRIEVRLHLMMCRICREYVRQMTLVVGALGRLRGPDGPVAASPVAASDDLLALFRAEHPPSRAGSGTG
jgi:predicted anti-sigma-YlaC factor YlaD